MHTASNNISDCMHHIVSLMFRGKHVTGGWMHVFILFVAVRILSYEVSILVWAIAFILCVNLRILWVTILNLWSNVSIL